MCRTRLTSDYRTVDYVRRKVAAFRHGTGNDGGSSSSEHELKEPVRIARLRKPVMCEVGRSYEGVPVTEGKGVAYQPVRDAAKYCNREIEILT